MKYLTVISLFIMYVSATPVKKCSAGSPDINGEMVQIGECRNATCTFRRKASIPVEIKFVPDRDVESVKNSIQALMLGVYMPYIGFDGTDACDSIYHSDGEKASCPLKSGEEYVYKNEFKVEEYYPKIRTEVKWALATDSGLNLFCFKVRVHIV